MTDTAVFHVLLALAVIIITARVARAASDHPPASVG